jgi:hypothetical protein
MKTQIKTTKNFDKLIEALKSGKLESNNQLTYMMSCLNNKPELKELIDEVLDCREIELDAEQIAKGYQWLVNQWKTPRGVERKNNPFGYREQDALENFQTIYFKGYYDAGNWNFHYYLPLYYVQGKERGFEYYVSGGQIHIVG